MLLFPAYELELGLKKMEQLRQDKASGRSQQPNLKGASVFELETF